jgi:hypothetical protein
MAITTPVAKQADLDPAFIEQAPDAGPDRWQRASRTHIMLSIALDHSIHLMGSRIVNI